MTLNYSSEVLSMAFLRLYKRNLIKLESILKKYVNQNKKKKTGICD